MCTTALKRQRRRCISHKCHLVTASKVHFAATIRTCTLAQLGIRKPILLRAHPCLHSGVCCVAHQAVQNFSRIAISDSTSLRLVCLPMLIQFSEPPQSIVSAAMLRGYSKYPTHTLKPPLINVLCRVRTIEGGFGMCEMGHSGVRIDGKGQSPTM